MNLVIKLTGLALFLSIISCSKSPEEQREGIVHCASYMENYVGSMMLGGVSEDFNTKVDNAIGMTDEEMSGIIANIVMSAERYKPMISSDKVSDITNDASKLLAKHLKNNDISGSAKYWMDCFKKMDEI